MSLESLDRFGIKLEKRFTKMGIEKMMINSGLDKIEFGAESTFCCVVGLKK